MMLFEGVHIYVKREGLPLLAARHFQSGCIGLKNQLDFITHATELGHDFLFSTLGASGVAKAPVIAVHLTWKHGALLVCITADRDDRIDVFVEKLVHVF